MTRGAKKRYSLRLSLLKDNREGLGRGGGDDVSSEKGGLSFRRARLSTIERRASL